MDRPDGTQSIYLTNIFDIYLDIFDIYYDTFDKNI